MAKKKIKKIQKKVAPKKKTSHPQELVIKVQSAPTPIITTREIEEPIHDGKNLAIPKTWVSNKQIMRMVQKTPPQHVYTRPGKGGQKWSYVTGNYIEKVLNYVFGFMWDFEIVAHGKEGTQVWVQGKLTVKSPNGDTITKSQFGRADIKFLKGKSEMLDFGNDLKGATTDCLKKCASLLGIASDIYGKAEFKQEAGVDLDKPPMLPTGDSIAGPDGEPVYTCKVCDIIISEQEAGFSKKIFGKTLCREHQANAKRK